jgi:hypothetical protein
MTTNNAVNTTLSGQTGTGSFVGSTSPTLVTPTLGVSTAKSINFGGSTLSNYVSETSWTPVFTFVTPGNLSVAYTTQIGTYTRIGSVVYVTFALIFTPTFSTSSGNVEITGLPIVSANTGFLPVGNIITNSVIFAAGYTHLACGVLANTTFITLYQSGTTAAFDPLAINNFVTGTAYQIYGSCMYFV